APRAELGFVTADIVSRQPPFELPLARNNNMTVSSTPRCELRQPQRGVTAARVAPPGGCRCRVVGRVTGHRHGELRVVLQVVIPRGSGRTAVARRRRRRPPVEIRATESAQEATAAGLSGRAHPPRPRGCRRR
ncbi:unnamed protein product, partial [Ectocarpus sp. 12 AP-2014]